jgi:hypothetical protein
MTCFKAKLGCLFDKKYGGSFVHRCSIRQGQRENGGHHYFIEIETKSEEPCNIKVVEKLPWLQFWKKNNKKVKILRD